MKQQKVPTVEDVKTLFDYQLEESELKQFSFKQIQEKVKNLGKKNTKQKLDQQTKVDFKS